MHRVFLRAGANTGITPGPMAFLLRLTRGEHHRILLTTGGCDPAIWQLTTCTELWATARSPFYFARMRFRYATVTKGCL